MAFIYSDAEAEIIQRLQTKITGAGVNYEFIQMPENEEQYNIGNDGVLVTVVFLESSFDKPDSLSVIKQKETCTFLCNIKSPKLRGSNSMHEAFRLIKMALVGYRLMDMGKLYLQKIEYDERNDFDNFFSWNVIFNSEKIHIEYPDEDPELPLLKTVFWRDEFTITTDIQDGSTR